ncbi:PepSY-associated TM helix domain-containing protein [Methylobacterium radiotolerans]|uniref:PepSY-associated TM helix domain-containing protein n=1 Tax=Methylobacterium radiotolerans TaxID=31998 RepID=UPI001F391BA1|nr:PepSY-associated TM helix domain-containing protein [Methylobacterium radiotolerans]UIY45292.1 PepSY domain-containing protein [Methylobacterium radiotolerans]
MMNRAREAADAEPSVRGARRRRLWSRIHTWSSLISTAFMLMLCLTGLPLIFYHEIDEALGYAPELPTLGADAPFLSLNRIVEAARMSRSEEATQFLLFDREEPNLVFVSLSRHLRSAPPESLFAMDRRTGRVVQEPKLRPSPMTWLLKLHVDMFLGLGGKLFLGLIGLVLALAVVSGIVLYGPAMRKRAFGTVRGGRTRRIYWFDWHNLVGITTLGWALLVAGTGTVNTWADLMLKLWQRDQLVAMAARDQDGPSTDQRISVAAAVAVAQAAAPGKTLRFVAYPGTVVTSDRHYAVFLSGASVLTGRLLEIALVNAVTGRLTAHASMPWYAHAVFLSQPLHFGNYGGLALKLVWAGLDLATLAVLATGLYLWAGRRAIERYKSNTGPTSPPPGNHSRHVC